MGTSSLNLDACRAQTIKLAEEVASPRFGTSCRVDDEIVDTAGLRAHLQTTVSDSAVSELDLLRASTIMAQFIRAAERARASLKRPEAEIRKEIALALWVPSTPPTEAELAKEMADVDPKMIANQYELSEMTVSARTGEVGVMAALHSAIQAQLSAQPGVVSALEYIKDNAERFGVNDAIDDVRRSVRQLQYAEITTDAKQVLGKAKDAALDLKDAAQTAAGNARDAALDLKDAAQAAAGNLKDAAQDLFGRLFGGR